MRYVVRLLPRNRFIWAFSATGGFRDNPKYLYCEVITHHPEIKAVWITHNRDDVNLLRKIGMPVYYWSSFKGLYYALVSGVYVVDHSTSSINRLFDGGAFYVNLWHGCGIKKIRWQDPEGFVRQYHLKDASEMRKSLRFRILTYDTLGHRPDLLLAPSNIQLKQFFAPMMDVSEKNCVVGVYPRSKLMIEGREATLNYIRKYEPDETLAFVDKLSEFHKTYIYMPTWRNDGRDFIEQIGADWQQLNNLMMKNNSLFILKFHPFTNIDIKGISQFSNICIYPQNCDVYTLLPFIDCLITDYSSIYTDFLMMNKEIILFVFDYKEYVEGSYGLHEYDKYYVGKRAFDFNHLLKTIESGEDCHVPKEQYDFLMKFYWDNNRYNIDITEEIKKRIGIK